MKKNISELTFEDMMVDVIGCKWTHKLLTEIANGNNRPGQIRKTLNDMSAKVFSENAVRMTTYKLVTKTEFNELPQRVEYHITPFGKRLLSALDHLALLKEEF